MTLKEDVKFEEKLICYLKNDKNLVNFDLSTQNSQNFVFDWFLLCKVYNFWPKKAQRSYLSWHWKLMQSLKKNWLVVWKVTWKMWQIFTRKTRKSLVGTLMGSFYPKYKMYKLKIYRGVNCHDKEEWCKIWRGIDLLFQNWHEEFNEFWPEHSKVSKICNLTGSFSTKYIMSELKKYRGVLSHYTEERCKIWRKTNLWFRKWHEEFSPIFTRKTWKSQNWGFDGIVLSKVKNLWA